MNTDLLLTFLSVVEAGSFSAAAERLRAQVSTVSRRVADLEEEIGAELLIRGGRGIRLNPAGEAFAERARHVLAELEHAVAVARGDATTGPAHLRISVPLELALSLLPDAVAAAMRAFPAVTLHVHSDARRVSLVEEDFDAAIRLGAPKSSELIARSLGTVSLVAACHPSCVLERGADLPTRRFVFPGAARRTVSATWGKREVILGSTSDPTVGSFTEAAELATRLELAAVLPSYTAVRYLRDGRLALLHPKLGLAPTSLHFVLPQRHRKNPALAELGEQVRASLEAVETELGEWVHRGRRRRT